MQIKVIHKYSVTPNHISNDKNLSWKAKGLWTYIQSKPDGWDFNSERMSEDSTDGKDSTRSGLVELQEAGYLRRTKVKNQKGHWEWNYELFDTRVKNAQKAENPPKEKTPSEKSIENEELNKNEEKSKADSPALENPPLEKPVINKERISNKEYIYSEAEASGSLPPKGKKEKKKKEPKPIVIFTPELLEVELEKMESKENSHLDIIATFIREKKIKVLNSKQLELLIKRHCQPASQLSGAYSNKEIFRAMEKLQKDYEKEVDRGKAGSPVEWTLETVIKVLTK